VSAAAAHDRGLSAGARFAWVDSVLPAKMRDASAEERGRARVVVLALIPFFVVAIPVMGEYYFGGSPVAAGLIAATVFAAAWSPALMRFGLMTVVHYELALFVVLMAVLAWFSGGLGAPPLYGYVLIPTLGVALVGRTSAVVWSGIASLVLMGFLALEVTGHSPPSDVAVEALTRGHAVLGVLGIAVALVFTLLHDAHRRRVLEDLEQARVHAEVANRAKSAFLANVGHELRTPMTGVLGMSALLQRAEIAPEHREMVGVIEKSAGSLLTLLDDILDYAQLEVGQLRVESKAFEVRSLVQETMALVAPLADGKRLEFGDRVHRDVPAWLVGDARRIRQILLNLLGNAIKFTDVGHVTLDVRMEAGATGSVLVLGVEDTGRGIPAEARSRIFERFERVQASDGRMVPGSGLGLAICRGLVDLIGGEMELESQEGSGSCFTVRVPLGLVADDSDLVADAPEERSLPDSLGVLVAEDNPVSQLVICRMLQALGCRVTLAEDGEACLACIAEDDFDAILMDCQMPRMDGLVATRAVRASPDCESLPVIGLTASVTAEARDRCFEAGMDEVLAKPCSLEDLREVLARHCGTKAFEES
jgi:signal transduction histidine kinase/CheY-like chemotaxis protein